MDFSLVTVSLFCLSLFIPWSTGAFMVHAALGRSPRWNKFCTLGAGYFIGMILATASLSATSTILGQFSPFIASTALAIISFFAVITFTAYGGKSKRSPQALENNDGNQNSLLVLAILILAALKFTVLLISILATPLYPWDSWSVWHDKASVWFSLGQQVQYVDLNLWLQQSSDGEAVFTSDSWHYPAMIPLIRVWTSCFIGYDSPKAANLQWLFCLMSLCIFLYGMLLLHGLSKLRAILAAYLLLSVPLLNTHVALAGYSDLWLAALFSVSVFFLLAWHQYQHVRYLLMAFIFAGSCIWAKLPGIVFFAIILATTAACFLTKARKLLYLSVLFTASLLTYSLVYGLSVDIPLLGSFSLNRSGINIPGIAYSDFTYSNQTQAFYQSLFLSQNWSLLWVCTMGTSIYWLVSKKNRSTYSLLSCSILFTAFAVLGVIFSLTNYAEYAANHALLSRTVLYLTPLAAFISAHLFKGAQDMPRPEVTHSPIPR